MDAAAELLLAEGLDASIARHARVAAACRAGVRGMGLQPWAAREEIAAPCVTAIRVPDGLTDLQVRDHVRARYGVQFSGGQGAGPIIRIGHMGLSARPMYPIVGLSALGRGLLDLGARVDVGAGIEAALAALSASAERRRGIRRVTTLAPFELHRATTVAEATALLDELGDDAVVYSGGTELLLLMKLGFAAYGHLVDVKPIDALRSLEVVDGTLVIGGTVTHRTIERSPLVAAGWPALAEMERSVANIRVRTVGTLGGNLAFADPHSDPATFLLAADARVRLQRGDETRTVAIGGLRPRPVRHRPRAPASCSSRSRCPAVPPGAAMAHRKFSFHERPAATVACLARVADGRIAEARISVGSVGIVPVRVPAAEALLAGADAAALDADLLADAGSAAADAADPVEDANGSAAYKRTSSACSWDDACATPPRARSRPEPHVVVRRGRSRAHGAAPPRIGVVRT